MRASHVLSPIRSNTTAHSNQTPAPSKGSHTPRSLPLFSSPTSARPSRHSPAFPPSSRTHRSRAAPLSLQSLASCPPQVRREIGIVLKILQQSSGGPSALPSLYSRTAGPKFDKALKNFSGRCFAIPSNRSWLKGIRRSTFWLLRFGQQPILLQLLWDFLYQAVRDLLC